MKIIFRKIQDEEVDELREIGVKTFKHSYEHLNSPENFLDYLSKAFTNEKLLQELREDESFFYFVILEKEIIGYLKLNIGSCQTEEHSGDYLEIERIYLDENYQRKGIGKLMIEFAFDKAKELQKSKIWLGVWDKNPQAIQFYQRMGFQSIGTHIFKFGNEDQTDRIMEVNVPMV